MATINDVWTAYDGADGQWTGCDWPTHYGSLGWDLNGIRARRAYEAVNRWRAIAEEEVADDDITAGEEASLVGMAEHLRLPSAVVFLREDRECRPEVRGRSARLFCADVLAREWEFAAHWLEEIESDAAWAREEAQEAVRAAERDDWDYALSHACHACAIEAGYDDWRPWRHLEQVIEEVTR